MPTRAGQPAQDCARPTNENELPVSSYEFFADRDLLTRGVIERMLPGVSTRKYKIAGEPVVEDVEREASAAGKSTVSELFIGRTRTALGSAAGSRRPLGGDDARRLEIADRAHVVALGIITDVPPRSGQPLRPSPLLDTVVSVARRAKIKPITSIDDPRYVKALSHPLRIRILALLQERDASPVQLAEHLDATLGTVAYHVRTLQRFGLVEEVATHQRRGATEHVFAVRGHPRLSDHAWAQASPMAKHVLISSSLAQAGDFASQSAAKGGFDRADAHASRNTLKLDEKGWTALAAASKKWLNEAKRIEAQAEKRMQRSDEAPFDVGLVILLFEAVGFFESSADGDRAKPRMPRRSQRKAEAV